MKIAWVIWNIALRYSVTYSLDYPVCSYRIPVERFLKDIQKNKAHNLVHEENGNQIIQRLNIKQKINRAVNWWYIQQIRQEAKKVLNILHFYTLFPYYT